LNPLMNPLNKVSLNVEDHHHIIRDLAVKQNLTHQEIADIMTEQLKRPISKSTISRFCSKHNISKRRR